MTSKVSTEYDGKPRTLWSKNCTQCGVEFWVPKNQLNRRETCSKECRHKYDQRRVALTCSTCSKPFERAHNKVRSEFQFCSRLCKDLAQRIDTGIREMQPEHYGLPRLHTECLSCDGPLSNRRRGMYCSVRCQMDTQYVQYIERWKSGLESGNRCTGRNLIVSAPVRRYLFNKFDSKCAKCGWAEMNQTSGRIPLVVDHIDGNPWRTVEDNLTLLCPNCNSLTPTYGALNRGRGRVLGALAHSGERNHGMVEVAGAEPAGSTKAAG